MARLKVGVLVSGFGSNLQALIVLLCVANIMRQ